MYNIIILDESGSMQSIRQSTINSFNEVVQTMRNAQMKSETEKMLQEHFVTLCTFNGNGIREVLFQVSANQAPELTTETYRPNSMTPLFDAMGKTLLKHEFSIEGKENLVTLITILTDGAENGSKEFTASAITAMVNRLKEKGWVFIYIGTDHDVESFSASMSIRSSMRYQKSQEGMLAMSISDTAFRQQFYDNIKDKSFDTKQANEDFYKDLKDKQQKKGQGHPTADR